MSTFMRCVCCGGPTTPISCPDNKPGCLVLHLHCPKCSPAAPAPTPGPRDAEIERLRSRLAALEAALKRTADCDHHEECPGAYDEHGDVPEDDDAEALEHCECGVGWAREALDGGTSALSAALATERMRVLDAVKARVEGLPRSPVDHVPPMVVLSQVLAAIEAAREGAGSGRRGRLWRS